MKLSFKQWKRGLIISILNGSLTGVIGFAVGITWKQALLIIAINAAKDATSFIKLHPADEITDGNTTTIIKQQGDDNVNTK